MSTDTGIEESIDAAAEAVGSVWPLHSFVTANPLAGFEDRPFHEAVREAQDVLGGDGYPSADVFGRALETGRIEEAVLERELRAAGYEADPETSLDRLASEESRGSTGSTDPATERVDTVLTKWLAAFLDQGRAEWSMPNRDAGFYGAVKRLAPYDRDVPDGEAIAALPEEPVEAVRELLVEHPVGDWRDVFEFQLAALPGWTGLLKRRAEEGGDWQSAYPVSLAGYLAVRLALVEQFDAPLAPETGDDDAAAEVDADGESSLPLPEVWLRAWEASYRSALVERVAEASAATAEDDDGGRPDAQFVFCIDTRSEIVRRHIEASGDYETHGYAGFFGIPMRYEGYDADVTVDACPPILEAEHRIADRPTRNADTQHAHDGRTGTIAAGKSAVKRLKSNAATAFSFVESAGLGYGAGLTARTLLPERVHGLLDRVDDRVPADHEFCTPTVDYNPDSLHELREGLTLDEQVEYAATAFELMGWEQFARVVVFAGHASETANNPFDSSLDCGACAGNPGGPSARVLAAICNRDEVQAALRERGIDIPDDTVFVAGEHNTTTDEVELYTTGLPESHGSDVESIRSDLATARAGAAAERADDMGAESEDGVGETERRAADWAETRPEWGLAGNAGFVVGPRALTADLDLDGRTFLHSYDWSTDPDGEALAAILAGPMVVTQWINTQYYFATVDNAAYGSGSKVTQNPVGNVGVYQGNGGDLLTGLPLQSLVSGDGEPYHQPIRLSTVVHAPVERAAGVLSDHPELARLLDNGWLSLTVVDPEQGHRPFHYVGDGEWTEVSESQPTVQAAPTQQSVRADD